MDKTQARQKVLAFFTTLANNKPATSEWNMGQRNVESRDIFAVLNNSYTQTVCGGAALTLRIDNRKDGKVTLGRAEACSWGIDDLVGYAQELTELEIRNLDAPCERLPAVAKIAKLLDEGETIINGKTYTCRWEDADEVFGERFHVHTMHNSSEFGGDELLTMS